MSPDEAIDPQTELLIEKVSGNPIAMLMLARTLLLPNGKTMRARELAEAALALAPDDGEVKALSQAIRSRGIGNWYFTMIQDHGRHARYAEAFRRVLTPGCTVLDMGAGTGLFAMLAARAGAGKVVACERDAAIADAAREIIEKNDFADRVTVIAKESRDLEMGIDLDGPADVLLWDNLANDLVGVGGLEAVEDARRRLLKPRAPIIPGRCEMRVALAESSPVSDTQMGIVDGFDMTPFNRFRPTQTRVSKTNFELRSRPVTIFDFDFSQDEVVRERNSRVVVPATGGRVDGIVQWLRFHLADDVVYDTGEDEGVTAFGVQYHAVEPFDPEPGQQIAIAGGHDRLRTWFWIGAE